jgi:hypothetical protein
MAGLTRTAVPAGEAAPHATENRPKKNGSTPRAARRRPARNAHAPRRHP